MTKGSGYQRRRQKNEKPQRRGKAAKKEEGRGRLEEGNVGKNKRKNKTNASGKTVGVGRNHWGYWGSEQELDGGWILSL